MGDPEAEVVLPRLKNDLLKLLIAVDKQELHLEEITIDKKAAAAIVAVSGGYPLEYEKGFAIDFGYLENPHVKKHIKADGGVMVFHGGTKKENGTVVTNGGRVLAVCSLADTLSEAIDLSKEIIEQIHFDGMYYRNDIGYEFIE
ncbi:MAG: phosphoribosylglycinamide synthetase C domain-containing protein [Ginsengibacter sp.]